MSLLTVAQALAAQPNDPALQTRYDDLLRRIQIS